MKSLMKHVLPLVAVVAWLLAGFPVLAQDTIPRLNTYYLDLDQDSYGGSYSFQVDSPAPPNRIWTSWGNDPDDNDPYNFPVPVPKGSRILGIDFSDSALDHTWRADLARELGAEATPLYLLWNFLESAPYTYNGSQSAALRIANESYGAQGLQLSLTVSPISTKYLAVPNDLRLRLASGDIRFSDAEFINRFNGLLDYVHAQLPDVPLISLQIGNEIDLYFPEKPDMQFWIDFHTFYVAVSAHAKSLWGNTLKVGMTATQSGLVNEPTKSLMQALNGASDMVSVTYFPRSSSFTLIEPINVEPDIQQLTAAYGLKPLYFQAVGIPSTPLVLSSQVKQSQYLKSFFDAWDKHAASIPFVSFHRLHDFAPARAESEAGTYGVPVGALPTVSGYLETLGLRTYPGTGSNKTAYNTLRNLAFERGWWRIEPRTTRSFYLGFTPSPYDFAPDMQDQIDVANYVDGKIATEGDIIALHMDGGVPWVEAYADTFQSVELPYSASVKAAWENYKNRLPGNHKLLVSINPLGIPRNQMAPYWGYGEGFDYTPTFDRVGNGTYQDDERRLPPPPWNTYNFNDMPVKVAFLNYAKRVLQYFHPDYLCIAIEVSANQVSDPTQYPKFMELHKYVYQQLKLIPEYSHVKILVSFSATSYMTDEYAPLVADWSVENGVTWKLDEMKPGVRPQLIQGFKDILPYTDIIGLSLYPHFGKYNAYTMPASMYDSMFDMFAQAGAGQKPIAVTESGYAADQYNLLATFFAASPEKQDRHYKLMFYELEKHSNPVEFVISFKVRDSDLAWQRQNDSGVNPAFVEFYKYFRDIGIYDGNGLERPSTLTWRNELALPRMPKNVVSRSFKMGFTSHTPENSLAGYTATFNMLRDHADLISHIFNDGVPWPEALLSDDYHSYSANLQDSWNMLRNYFDSALPGHARYLMLNPINTTHDGLASHWGEQRHLPLPAPWNQYPFNHPDVKQAYVNYVSAAVNFFQPEYLAINVESNILLAKSPVLWNDFKELTQYVYSAIKARFPNIKVFSTIQYEHMLGLHDASAQLKQQMQGIYPDVLQNEVRSLLQNSDLFAVSTYPHRVAGNVVRDNYYDPMFALATATNKPVAIDQTGYTSKDVVNMVDGYALTGSDSLQTNFLNPFLQKLQEHGAQFVVNFVSVDYGTNYGLDFTALTWAFTGLRTLDGSDKPALKSWDTYLRLPYVVAP